MAKHKVSYTRLTLNELRKQGAVCGIVEKWNPHAKVRQDLFGFIDIVALRDGKTIGVQSTSGVNHSARKNKIYGIPEAQTWIKCKNVIEVWSWLKKPAEKGSKKMIWVPRVDEITMDMINDYMQKEKERGQVRE